MIPVALPLEVVSTFLTMTTVTTTTLALKTSANVVTMLKEKEDALTSQLTALTKSR